MDTKIIDTLMNLTYKDNNLLKIAAIRAIGNYELTSKQEDVILRLIELSNNPNQDIAISAVQSLSQLSQYFKYRPDI
nr:HEAT repeat domain-containing protein [uncultured Moellerella sp.]